MRPGGLHDAPAAVARTPLRLLPRRRERGGGEFESAGYSEVDDTIGTAMLGMTVGGCRCHDHKFDRLPQADYYRLAATFTSTIRSNVELRMARSMALPQRSSG